MSKNWSNRTKIIVALIVAAIIIAAFIYWDDISAQLGWGERSRLMREIRSRHGYDGDFTRALNQLSDDDLRMVLNGGSGFKCENPCGGRPPFKGLCLKVCPN